MPRGTAEPDATQETEGSDGAPLLAGVFNDAEEGVLAESAGEFATVAAGESGRKLPMGGSSFLAGDVQVAGAVETENGSPSAWESSE